MAEATRVEVSQQVSAWSSEVPVGDDRVWSLATAGLGTFDHPELAFPVRAHPQLDHAATTRTLVQVIRAIAAAAANGQRVAPGGTTRFGGPVLGFDGVFYVPPAPIGEHHLPAASLVGLFASADELTGVEQFGARRLASLLARQTRYFPYPPWTDVARERFAVGRWPSVVADMPRLGLPSATITQHAGALHLRLGRGRDAAVLRAALAQLPPAVPPTFVLNAIDASADSCLVWAPDQQAPEAVAPPGSRGEHVGGCFLATANEQPANGSQLVEDGFAYFLRDADHARLRAAWEAQTDVVVRGERPGDDLVVTWVDEAPAAQASPRRVRLVGVELMVPFADGDASTVAAYVQALAAVAERTLPSVGAPYEVRLEVQPRAPIQIATRPLAPPTEAMQRCLDELRAVPAPTLGGPLGFSAHLAVEA